MRIQTLEHPFSGHPPDWPSQWREGIENDPHSTCYHLLGWKDVAENAYGLSAPFLIARDSESGPIRGGLPLFVARSPWQRHISNGLFGAYGEIIAKTESTIYELVKKAKALLEREHAKHLMLKCLNVDQRMKEKVFFELGFRSLDLWVIAKLKLDPDPDRVWHGFRDKIRNCVRKGQKAGLTLRTGEEWLEPFYEVLAENMHQKGTPIYGFRFIQEVFRAMGGRAEILTLWKDDVIVSGALVIDHHRTTYVPFASSKPSALQLSPNNLLYWEIIRRACLKGCEVLDFGRSVRNSGSLAFKVGWGAEVIPQPSFLYSTSRTWKNVEFDQKNADLEWFVKNWKRLPISIANAAGPTVCRWTAGLI